MIGSISVRDRQMNTRQPRRKNAQLLQLSPFFQPLESLERRVFLSVNSTAGAFQPAAPAYQAPISTDVADAKSGPMASAGEQLIDLYRDFRKFQRNGGATADFTHELSEQVLMLEGRVGVTVRGRGTFDGLVARLRQSGAELIFRNPKLNVVDAWVPVGQLHDLAADRLVVAVNPIYRPVTNTQGSSDNQGDRVLKADRLRSVYGLDGSGVMVGVQSDSVNKFRNGIAGSIATGDLPATGVTIINDSPFPRNDNLFGEPTDEGRAMLELIHDIAPKAALAFGTADFGIQTFADNIRALNAAGAQVIVDDIIFQAESWFQPSIVDRAITDVTTDGAIYFSSAGNASPNSAFEGPTNFVKLGRDRFVDFNPGSGADTRLRVTSAGGTVGLQWDNAYDGVVGNATADLDIYIYDSVYGRLVSAGVSNNLKTTLPVEFVGLPGGTYDIEIRLADSTPGAPLPTRFRFVGLNGSSGMDVNSVEYGTPTGSIIGHNGGENTISVGAVPFFFPSQNEDFSSTGPVTRLFDATGARLPAPVSLQKPDISSIDNVNTSFFGEQLDDGDRLPNFSGTSAAAPNAAAVAALLKQADPTATRASIVEAFQLTAIPLNGAFVGNYDPQGGFGLIDAFAAAEFFVKAPTVDIVDVKPDPIDAAVESVKIVFNQRVSGLDIADFTLRRSGGPNLLTGDQTIRTTDNGRTYLLRNLSGITFTDGNYVLTLSAASTGITNAVGQGLVATATDGWSKLSTPPIPEVPTNVLTKVIDEDTVRVRFNDNSAMEDGFTIQRADDDDFTVNVKSFELPANTTVFTDEVLVPAGKHYFYRVRSFNDFAGFSSYTASAEAFTPAPGEIILDDAAGSGVKTSGAWSTAALSGATGGTALTDLNSGKGEKYVRFTPNIQFNDDYFVYAKWIRGSDRATNVPVDIFFGPNGTQRKTIYVNQRDTGGDGWVLLGKFKLSKGTAGYVRFRNFATDGLVVADAVRFLPARGR
jgi:hypothetical protein